MKPQGILFDLDGTLLDTAADLVYALSALTDQTIPMTKELRAAAGKGFKGLLKAGLDIDDQDERYLPFSKQFQNHYDICLLRETKLFTGMQKVLDHLDKINLPWGIVTNKPHQFTQKIIDGLELTTRTHCLISGDSLAKRKPHPEPLLHACHLLKKSPAECIYIGDSESDVIASKAAGLSPVVALYGYISSKENPHAWDADGYILHPEEILTLIES